MSSPFYLAQGVSVEVCCDSREHSHTILEDWYLGKDRSRCSRCCWSILPRILGSVMRGQPGIWICCRISCGWFLCELFYYTYHPKINIEIIFLFLVFYTNIMCREKGSYQLYMTLSTLPIYLSVHKQLIRNILEDHIVPEVKYVLPLLKDEEW